MQNRWEFEGRRPVAQGHDSRSVERGGGHVRRGTTDRALEDWIFEDLFEGPTVRGLAGGGSELRLYPRNKDSPIAHLDGSFSTAKAVARQGTDDKSIARPSPEAANGRRPFLSAKEGE